MGNGLRLTCAFFASTIAVGCSQYLHLDILNATDAKITVAVDGQSSAIDPGRVYSIKYPEGASSIVIKSLSCTRVYDAPDLDKEPWKYLIGDSVKFRAMPSGAVEAYPPTPDVELTGNPLRAMTMGQLTLQLERSSCR